jgi:phosphomannomutase/phosphoglucomutase
MTITLNPQAFREYDIRGYVEKDLSNEFAFALGQAFGSLVVDTQTKGAVAVGYDARISSPGYAENLSNGIASFGVDVVQVGMGPTPHLYFAIFQEGLAQAGGIQVTGSHNPPDMNGFKLCLGTQTLSGPAIQDLLKRAQDILAGTRVSNATTAGKIYKKELMQEYIDFIIENSRSHFGERKLKIVCDAGNGVGGMAGPQVLRGLGCEVIELYCEPDGNFPNHHPDPTVPDNIKVLIETVKKTGADFGIGWDGDADRIGVVDEKGQILYGDMLLLMYAKDILRQEPGATFIGDVKCSQRVFDGIAKAGGNPIMWKTGHSLVKNKLKETGAALAGEMSGHIFFKHRYFGFDDAIYSSARFAELVSKSDMQVSEMLRDLPEAVSTPELRVDCPEELKFKVPEMAKQAFSKYKVDTTDGVRINFGNGWGLIRASNTQPVLVLRFEAKTQAELDSYQAEVVSWLESVAGKVSFATH